MININGKEWSDLTFQDIESLLLAQDSDESFFFEFKDDRVSPAKVSEEISAFANTFGGYIFIGVSDEKHLDGCIEWTEQRIHTTIHDSVTPTPSFDIKKFINNGIKIYVIKIDEGSEPPYITSKGKIFERLSSGSFLIKDSIRLSQLIDKREQNMLKMEKTISIDPVAVDSSNILGYIDIGFALVSTDRQKAINTFINADLRSIAKEKLKDFSGFSLTTVGNSIVYTPGGLSTDNGKKLPAHLNNFMEIMADGSARMRLILINNNPDSTSANLIYSIVPLAQFKDLYTYVMGDLFPDGFSYAKKFESLTIRNQFQPLLYYDESILNNRPELQEDNQALISRQQKNIEIFGASIIITNDRIPKTGLHTIDRRWIQKLGLEFSAQSIIDELFNSQFSSMGFALDNE